MNTNLTLRPICLAGPTGCGKTAAALALAEYLPLEIISVDSALSTAAWTSARPSPRRPSRPSHPTT